MADEAMGATTYLFEHEMKLKNALFYFISIHSRRRRRKKEECAGWLSHWEFCLNGVKSVADAAWLVVPWSAGLATNAPHDVLERGGAKGLRHTLSKLLLKPLSFFAL